MLDQGELARTVFPVGDFAQVRGARLAAELGLRTADKPDSQDVCFITSTGGRAEFLGAAASRCTPAHVVDTAGRPVGTVPAVELVTRRSTQGARPAGWRPRSASSSRSTGRPPRWSSATRTSCRTTDSLVEQVTWVGGAIDGELLVQTSAHGAPHRAVVVCRPDARVDVCWLAPQRRVAVGQSVVFYDRSDRYVLGGGIAT